MNQVLLIVTSIKPDVGQNIVLHVSPTARNIFLSNVWFFLVHSTSFFQSSSNIKRPVMLNVTQTFARDQWLCVTWYDLRCWLDVNIKSQSISQSINQSLLSQLQSTYNLCGSQVHAHVSYFKYSGVSVNILVREHLVTVVSARRATVD